MSKNGTSFYNTGHKTHRLKGDKVDRFFFFPLNARDLPKGSLPSGTWPMTSVARDGHYTASASGKGWWGHGAASLQQKEAPEHASGLLLPLVSSCHPCGFVDL